MKPFTEDDIRRTGLPTDVMGLLHDLCYHVNNNLRGTMDERAIENYVGRAQKILTKKSSPDQGIKVLLTSIEKMNPYVQNDMTNSYLSELWKNVLKGYQAVKKSYSNT